MYDNDSKLTSPEREPSFKEMQKCRLCGQEKELRGSHIVPKFFFNLIKKNSPTGRMRNGDNPNIPRQDGEKAPFLCADCEEKFSKYETWFSRHVYQSFSGSYGVDSFDSNSDETHYFALSISWRVVKYIRERKLDGLTTEE